MTPQGLCDCNEILGIEVYCDKDCQEASPSLQLDSSGLSSSSGTGRRLETTSIIIGDMECNQPLPCSVYTLVVNGGGVFGVYGILDSVADAFGNTARRRLASEAVPSTLSAERRASLLWDAHVRHYQDTVRHLTEHLQSNNSRRHLQEENQRPSRLTTLRDLAFTSSGVVYIPDPVVCLELGDSVIWDLTASGGDYPIYLKDNLLNSEGFDAGSFRELAEVMSSNSANLVSHFVHTFDLPGRFVFGRFKDPNDLTLVTVMPMGTSCATTGAIIPRTSSGLVASSASLSDDFLMDPDWAVIISVLFLLVVMVFLAILGVYYTQKRDWVDAATRVGDGQEKYKKKSRKMNVTALHSRGQTMSTEASKDWLALSPPGYSDTPKQPPGAFFNTREPEAQSGWRCLRKKRKVADSQGFYQLQDPSHVVETLSPTHQGGHGSKGNEPGIWDEDDADIGALLQRLEGYVACFVWH